MYDYKNDSKIPLESRENMDLQAVEDAVRTILKAVGEDPDREGLVETPSRVAIISQILIFQIRPLVQKMLSSAQTTIQRS